MHKKTGRRGGTVIISVVCVSCREEGCYMSVSHRDQERVFDRMEEEGREYSLESWRNGE